MTSKGRKHTVVYCNAVTWDEPVMFCADKVCIVSWFMIDGYSQTDWGRAV